jgi:DNA-binding CsgD family transcriptional regulator
MAMLVGRRAETAAIDRLLAAAREGRSGVLVLRGEPGIGKSALLDEARERAADMVVLSARGVESESELAFAALHQLVRPALGRIDGIPPPQAAALRSALGFETGAGQQSFLVFAACLSLLSELADDRPVLCLVDDAHWLDAASTDAFRFVARRLDAEGIVALFAAREGDVRSFEAPELPSLVLEGLDAADAAELLARGSAFEAAPAVRDRLVERAAGNALALLEVPAALSERQLAGVEPLPDALPLTHELEAVFLERVRRLPEATQTLLLVAAADDSESAALVLRAAEQLGATADALAAAEAADLVSVDGLRIDFRHSLVRSAIYAGAPFGERRAAHRALADALADDDEHADRRAWHLAAAALEYDETVVRALEEAAHRAEERSGHVAAAKALERAAELTADPRERGRLLVGAARAASVAGADDFAMLVANRAAFLVEDRSLRAAIARARGLAEVRRGRPVNAPPLLTDAAREVAGDDPGAALDILCDAYSAASEGADFEALRAVCELAESIPPPPGDAAAAFAADLLNGHRAMMDGDWPTAAALFERALVFGASSGDERAILFAAVAAWRLGDDGRAAALYARGVALARDRGALGALANIQSVRATTLLLAQRFDEAMLAATESLSLTREVGAENLVVSPLSVLGAVAAVRGDEREAERLSTESLTLANSRGMLLRAALGSYGLGLLDLGRARWGEAYDRLDMPQNPFLATMTAPDRIEAAVKSEHVDEARALLARYERWATNSGAAPAQPRLASCRALLAEGDEATEHFEEAMRLGGDARPFDLGRICLLYGEHLRRERRRGDARAPLRTAIEVFDRLRAVPWLERASVELRATGETARKRDPSTIADLTPQELQIATLVSEGASNREIAAQLYLSPRTVEYHLRKVFTKLGITSRGELIRDGVPGRRDAGVAAGVS